MSQRTTGQYTAKVAVISNGQRTTGRAIPPGLPADLIFSDVIRSLTPSSKRRADNLSPRPKLEFKL